MSWFHFVYLLIVENSDTRSPAGKRCLPRIVYGLCMTKENLGGRGPHQLVCQRQSVRQSQYNFQTIFFSKVYVRWSECRSTQKNMCFYKGCLTAGRMLSGGHRVVYQLLLVHCVTLRMQTMKEYSCYIYVVVNCELLYLLIYLSIYINEEISANSKLFSRIIIFSLVKSYPVRTILHFYICS